MTFEFNDQDRRFMQRAMELASHAEHEGEVPVGAVLVKDGQIIAEVGISRLVITMRQPTRRCK